jgi:signal transduction histidine kinase/DNA-binding response OmpR family regulator
MEAPPREAFLGTSQEFQAVCDADGVLLWIDAAGRQLLKREPGSSLKGLVAPGTGDKLQSMLRAGLQGLTATWELVLSLDTGPRTLGFRARPLPPGRVAITGSLLPEEYERALEQISESLSEVATLHRDTERQQRELLHRHQELVRLHRELEESYRAVVALHAEIGEKDDSLRRAGEVKARLVANVSHEFRTPLNSILSLTKLLLSRIDGDINAEQETQLRFIKQSSEALYALVNDLLDLSKTEAGKIVLRPQKFTLQSLLASLRGMMKPLSDDNQSIELVVEEPSELVEFETDEGKVAQILRNLLSNAIKFTERGEVRVSAEATDEDVIFKVQDSGIGISFEDQARIFEEFYQIDNSIQRRVKGTGLGLPIARQLAERLGGSLEVSSELGLGSTFTLKVPRRHAEVVVLEALTEQSKHILPQHQPILVLEDDRQTLFLYEKYLRGSGFQVIPARTVDEARATLNRVRPSAIVLDIMLEGETSWTFLHDLKANEATRDIPALVVTVTNREEKARALGADEFFMKPVERDWLLGKLNQLARVASVDSLLVIDDDEVSRYLIKKHLEGTSFRVHEAENGAEGVRLARQLLPEVILLDFVMPGMSAFDVLDELKRDPSTRKIPVIIHTSHTLAAEERTRIEADASAILSKQSLSREIAMGRIREALEKAGIRANPSGNAHG